MGLSKRIWGSGNAADGIYLVTELEDDRGVSPSVSKTSRSILRASAANGP